MSDPKGLLDGVRVLDLTRVLAGPYCTMLLGDLGAEVIKVEEPSKGDDTRQWGPPYTQNGLSAYFISANRNKRSLTLNLRSPQGKALLRELIAQSDVLVENFKTGTLEKLGFSYEELKAIRPDIIYCTITGFGYSGPLKDLPGYDFISQAMGGMMSITGEADGEPIRVGVAIVDLLSGIHASNAIMAALFARERQKTGQRIDISLLDSQIATLSYVASNYLISGKPPKRYGNAHPNIVPYQSFQAADGYFAFAAGNDLQWARFCKEVGREDWARDERFASNPQRSANRSELLALLDELFAQEPIAHWLAVCERASVPAAPILRVDQALAHEQVRARGMLTEATLADGERIQMLGSPLQIPTQPAQVRLPPPTLGAHTDEVLGGLLGKSAAEIAALRAEQVI